jgi:hypothetical protein
MRDTRCRDHPRCFQFNWLSTRVLEQSDPFTEEYGHKVNVYFVKQPRFDALLSGIRAHHGAGAATAVSCLC